LVLAAVGKILKKEREGHRLTLEDVSAKTKVALRFLAAIENEEYDSLPPQSYTIGFIKLYAEAVGLDPGAIAAQFKRETGTTVERAATVEPAEHGNAKDLRERRIPRWLYLAVGAAIVFLIISSYGWLRSTPRAAHPAVVRPATTATGTAKP
jgi:cytoskeleton protein RodZ